MTVEELQSVLGNDAVYHSREQAVVYVKIVGADGSMTVAVLDTVESVFASTMKDNMFRSSPAGLVFTGHV